MVYAHHVEGRRDGVQALGLVHVVPHVLAAPGFHLDDTGLLVEEYVAEHVVVAAQPAAPLLQHVQGLNPVRGELATVVE